MRLAVKGKNADDDDVILGKPTGTGTGVQGEEITEPHAWAASQREHVVDGAPTETAAHPKSVPGALVWIVQQRSANQSIQHT